MTPRQRVGSFLGALSLALAPLVAHPAQAGSDPIQSQVQEVHDHSTHPAYGFRRGSFVVAPIPFSNPTIGSGLALGAGYLFKTDPSAKTSVIGLGGMGSDNGSRAYGAMVNLVFGNNRWLFKSFAGKADAKYDLYTPIGALPIRQTGTLGRVSLAYGVTPHLSFGGALRYLDTTVTLDGGGLPAIPPQYLPDLGLELLLSSFIAEWDTRDDSDYPTSGHALSLDAAYGQTLSGADRSYQKATLLFDIYHSLGDRSVIAARAALCGASSDTPFFDKCALGPTDSFRGFSATQFLDRRLLSAQAELRHRLGKRIGLVGFAGVGWVGPGFNDLDTGGTHSAAGLGLRYRLSKKFPVDFSVDYARNDLDENLLYIYVGQRF
ncbi:BamA/TamA family outer membrane protein [Seohaeicola saemankumensis]|nr:BamA/TamA family outer membrane protein [Seohaeicola saemankumensis]MCA0872855.1 BamA/TamA family outer membrane protein [Seohaeicola saemankumensis]